MPNKTIYIREEDASIFDRAQKMSKDSISGVVTTALREYVAKEEAKDKGDAESLKLVEEILAKAVAVHAADIHIQPLVRGNSVRLRVDGALRESDAIPAQQYESVIACIKRLAGEDGKIHTWEVAGKKVDVRVCCVTSVLGESVTMRILEKEATLPDLAGLEPEGEHAGQLAALAARSYGAVFVTGPTGCGKTTTIYSMLKHVDRRQHQVMTVEDPVEYILDGCVQIPLAASPSSSFPKTIRSILGSGPDVIFIGEIRDKESALLCLQAACTGHLVFSVLHTPSAPAALLRLVNIGIEPFLVRDGMAGVIGQRLVRRLCQACKAKDDAGYDKFGLRKLIEPGTQFFKAVGCKKCGQSGYRGMTTLLEILLPGPELQQALLQNVPEHKLDELAHQQGMKTLLEDGLDKAARGHTSIGEVLRVTRGIL